LRKYLHARETRHQKDCFIPPASQAFRSRQTATQFVVCLVPLKAGNVIETREHKMDFVEAYGVSAALAFILDSACQGAYKALS
jgi:hypothetical protein